WERWRWKVKRKLALVCLAAAGLAGGWFAARTRAVGRFDEVMAFRESHREDKHHAERRALTEKLLASLWGKSFLLGGEREARLRKGVEGDLEIDFWMREGKERQDIELVSRELKGDGAAKALYDRCGKFVESFARTKHRARIDEIRERARQLWRDETWAR